MSSMVSSANFENNGYTISPGLLMTVLCLIVFLITFLSY
jgi:hypothetical protein